MSNGVPAFRRPESRNAATTMTWMGLILGSLYYATGELALPMGVHAGGNFAVFSLFQEGPDANACFVRLTPTETHAPHLYAVPVVLGATLAAVVWARRGTLLRTQVAGSSTSFVTAEREASAGSSGKQ